MVCRLCAAAGQDFRVVLKDEHAFAVVNLEPLKKFHLMVLPVRHVESLDDLTKDESASMFHMLHKLEHAILSSSDESPVVWMHRGSHPSQPHLHIHIAPSKGDMRQMFSAFENIPYRNVRSDAELAEIKGEIVKHLR